MFNTVYLHTSWGEMAYADSGGSNCPLLFLHGTGCDSTDWLSVIDNLLQNHQSITVDFRGHGRSSIPTEPFTIEDLASDIILLIDSQDLQELILVGHSLGGMVAMLVGNCCPQVAGLVLLEGWTSLSAAGSAFDTGRFYGSLSKTQILEIQQKSEKTRSRFEPDVWNKFWQSVREFDGYRYLENATIPIYEVYGEMGKNDLTEQKLRIPPNPNIEVIWMQNAGHYLPHEYPEAVAEICQNLSKTT